MTKEEVIRWLISVKEEVDEYEVTMIYVSDKEADALGMAIEALQEETIPLSVADKIGEEREQLQEKVAELQEKIADRPHGEWIFEETDEYKRTYCSVCGVAALFVCVSDDHYGRRSHGEVRKTKFCPNCGADMRGENK